jgi:hypothetical protein
MASERSRQNAVGHGLTAEPVIQALVEDADDYAACELAMTAEFEAKSAVERELVLRLASLLSRLPRAPRSKVACSKHRRGSGCNFANDGKPVMVGTRELASECHRC